MRGRRDEANAWRRMAHLRDHIIHLMAGELAALARLCPLYHLDLHHVGVDKIFGCHSEAPGRDLLDGGAHAIAIRQRLVAVSLLAALAGVGFAADPVHRYSESRMRLAADRAERHGACREALDDLLSGLDLFERYRGAADIGCILD